MFGLLTISDGDIILVYKCEIYHRHDARTCTCALKNDKLLALPLFHFYDFKPFFGLSR